MDEFDLHINFKPPKSIFGQLHHKGNTALSSIFFGNHLVYLLFPSETLIRSICKEKDCLCILPVLIFVPSKIAAKTLLKCIIPEFVLPIFKPHTLKHLKYVKGRSISPLL